MQSSFTKVKTIHNSEFFANAYYAHNDANLHNWK